MDSTCHTDACPTPRDNGTLTAAEFEQENQRLLGTG